MRTLSATLAAAQKIGGKKLRKVVLTSGETSYTYTHSNRFLKILKLAQTEDSQTAEILLANYDQTLTDIDLKGYDAVLSLGCTTADGDEYSDYPPMKVIAQDFYSAGGVLVCQLSLDGIPNMLAKDRASDDYEHHKSSSKTVKDIITEILDGTPVAEELTEDQTDADDDFVIGCAKHGVGQRLILIKRTVTKASFWLKKQGSPTGDISYIIRASDDSADYENKVLADASTLTTSFVKYTVTFDTPGEITDEVWIYCEYTNGDADNNILIEFNTSNVKPNENLIMLMEAGLDPWVDYPNYDCKYEYAFQGSAGELGGGINVYSHCQSYTATYDSEDSLIDAYMPKDSFHIVQGESRQNSVNKLLANTGCKGRWEDDGEFHVFVPTTTGTSYDAEYAITSDHRFFSKSLRNALVLPNYVVVESRPTDDDQYSGYAVHQASIDALEHDSYEGEVRDYKRTALTSNAQATSIATAWIASLVLAAQRGSAKALANVGAEVYDYVKVTDARQGDSRTGNIGYINIRCDDTTFEMDFSFGRTSVVAVPGTRPSLLSPALTGTSDTVSEARLTWDSLMPLILQIQDNFVQIQDWHDWVNDKLERLQNEEPAIPEIWQDQQVINQYNEIGSRVIYIKVIKSGTALAVGEGQCYITITQEHDGWIITDVGACVYGVSSSGTPTFQIYNETDEHNILSTAITIDANEYNSLKAATPPVINSSYDDLEMGDVLRFDCTVAGTDTNGWDIWLKIEKPEV